MGNCELREITKRPCGTEGEGPPSADKQKEEKQRLGKCRTICGQEKDLRLRLRRIQSLTAVLSSDWSWLPVRAPGEERRSQGPGCGGRSGAQSAVGKSSYLTGGLHNSTEPACIRHPRVQWLGQGHSLQEEKATISLECCGKRQKAACGRHPGSSQRRWQLSPQ